ncbi:MAG: hypothetical protein NTV35_00100 [Chloroflexi bacterium]|nr:hypothetical protein [Chloroflexota bacterium]
MVDKVRANRVPVTDILRDPGRGSPCTTTWIDTSFGIVVATIVRSHDGGAEQVFLRGNVVGGESGAAIEALGRLITIVCEVVGSLSGTNIERFTSELAQGPTG